MLWFPVIFLMGSPHDVKSVLLMLISYLYFDCRGRLLISKYGQWFIDQLPSSFSKTILTYRRVCFKPQCNIHFVCFSSGFPVQNIWWTVNSYTASFRFLNNWRPRQITSIYVSVHVWFLIPTAKLPQERQCFQFMRTGVSFVDDWNTKCYQCSSWFRNVYRSSSTCQNTSRKITSK